MQSRTVLLRTWWASDNINIFYDCFTRANSNILAACLVSETSQRLLQYLLMEKIYQGMSARVSILQSAPRAYFTFYLYQVCSFCRSFAMKSKSYRLFWLKYHNQATKRNYCLYLKQQPSRVSIQLSSHDKWGPFPFLYSRKYKLLLYKIGRVFELLWMAWWSFMLLNLDGSVHIHESWP